MYVRFRRGTRPSKLLALGPFAAIGPMIAFFHRERVSPFVGTYYINVYDNIFDLDRAAGVVLLDGAHNGAGILRFLLGATAVRSFSLTGQPVSSAWRVHPAIDGFMSLRIVSKHYGDPEFTIRRHFRSLYEWAGSRSLSAAFTVGVRARATPAGVPAMVLVCAHSVLLVSLLESAYPNLFQRSKLCSARAAVYRLPVLRPFTGVSGSGHTVRHALKAAHVFASRVWSSRLLRERRRRFMREVSA